MTILIINAGSSSVKFTLFRSADKRLLASGLIERVGFEGTRLNYRNLAGDKIHRQVKVRNASEAMAEITRCLTHDEYGVIQHKQEVKAVAHRVVHGGEKNITPVIIDRGIKRMIQAYSRLAPLHNPANLKGIEACEQHFPGIPEVAVFDTAFHATIPQHAYLYGLPYQLYREDKIRKYGFHGTSHAYVCRETAAFLRRPLDKLKIISCHLGNGSSITAVDRGRSIDTSMGFTPLEGLIMGTRCGDIDAAVVLYLMEQKKYTLLQLNDLLNKHSGLLGMAGIGSSDLRDIVAAGQNGNHLAETAILAFAYRIKKYIGAYAFAMGGLDVIIFTAGIGENSTIIREMVCRDLDGLGIAIDPEKNKAGSRAIRQIQQKDCRVKILVVPTNEEKEIFLQAVELLSERH
jgi:acetate kinase